MTLYCANPECSVRDRSIWTIQPAVEELILHNRVGPCAIAAIKRGEKQRAVALQAKKVTFSVAHVHRGVQCRCLIGSGGDVNLPPNLRLVIFRSRPLEEWSGKVTEVSKGDALLAHVGLRPTGVVLSSILPSCVRLFDLTSEHLPPSGIRRARWGDAGKRLVT